MLEASITVEGNALRIGKPEIIAPFQSEGSGQVAVGAGWDVAGDGSRVVTVRLPFFGRQAENAGGPNLVRFALNWFEELRRMLESNQ